MKKRILFLLLIIFGITSFFVNAIDLNNIKTEDLRVPCGQNTSLIMGAASPFSIRLCAGTVIEYEIDGVTNHFIVDKLGDEAVIRYTTDGGKSYIQSNIKQGERTIWKNLTNGNYMFLYYYIYNANSKEGVIEINVPLLIRKEIPVNVNNSQTDELQEEIKKESKEGGYIKYLIGVIIVLVVILIILGPRKKDEEIGGLKAESSSFEEITKAEESKEEEEEKVPEEHKNKKEKKALIKKKKGLNEKPVKKTTYYAKPKKKSFNEEDVYVVKPSDEE